MAKRRGFKALTDREIKETIDEGCRLDFAKTSELAVEHGLSVYDAAYLELAIRRKLPLASRDDALCGAAKKCRVKLLL